VVPFQRGNQYTWRTTKSARYMRKKLHMHKCDALHNTIMDCAFLRAWEACAKLLCLLSSCTAHNFVDSPQMGEFYISAKAFDVLERLDPNPEYWEGKRGACVGLFQMIIAGKEPRLVLANHHATESTLILKFNSVRLPHRFAQPCYSVVRTLDCDQTTYQRVCDA